MLCVPVNNRPSLPPWQLKLSFSIFPNSLFGDVSGGFEVVNSVAPAALQAVTGPAMGVYSFYLFDRAGTCLYYRAWNREHRALSPVDDEKTMFGMLFALRTFTIKLAPSGGVGVPRYYATDCYALHYFETPTGLRFVLTTTKDFGSVDIARHLREIYSEIYVEFVVKNPLYRRGTVISSELFSTKLDSYVQSLPCF